MNPEELRWKIELKIRKIARNKGLEHIWDNLSAKRKWEIIDNIINTMNIEEMK